MPWMVRCLAASSRTRRRKMSRLLEGIGGTLLGCLLPFHLGSQGVKREEHGQHPAWQVECFHEVRLFNGSPEHPGVPVFLDIAKADLDELWKVVGRICEQRIQQA